LVCVSLGLGRAISGIEVRPIFAVLLYAAFFLSLGAAFGSLLGRAGLGA